MKSSENIKDKFKYFIDSRLQLQINGKNYNTQSQALNWKHKQLIAVASKPTMPYGMWNAGITRYYSTECTDDICPS